MARTSHGYERRMGSLREHNPSLWVATTEPGDFPALTGDDRADVVVVGAGIAGLTTARLLVEAGASVIVIDAGSVCAGATGYTTAKISSLHGRPTAISPIASARTRLGSTERPTRPASQRSPGSSIW